MANGPGVGMGGPSGPGGPTIGDPRSIRTQQQIVDLYKDQWRRTRETPEQRRKREEEERKKREAEERRRGRSLLTGYTAPNPRRRTLLAGGTLLAENQSPQIY